MDTAEPDVLVVGAGPAGVTAALLLADAGVTVEVVDKRRSVSPLPRARGIHARAVEILRLCGVEVAMRARELAIASRMEIRQNLAQPALGDRAPEEGVHERLANRLNPDRAGNAAVLENDAPPNRRKQRV